MLQVLVSNWQVYPDVEGNELTCMGRIWCCKKCVRLELLHMEIHESVLLKERNMCLRVCLLITCMLGMERSLVR
jgi:hypothetical protein